MSSKKKKGSVKMRTGNFMDKPEEGWSHNTAALAVGNGVYYSFPVRYVGSIQVMETMRHLEMAEKTAVCWEAISRCVDAAALRTKKKKRKAHKICKRFLADSPYVKPMELKINLSVEGIATSDLTSNEIISNDDIKKISFAAGGDAAEYDFLTYVAKDKRDNRYCHVFDCSILADDVLSTIGQIFNILTNNADEDLEADKAVIAAAPTPTVDNPLYHAMAGGGGGAPRASVGNLNAAYDTAGGGGAGGEPMYDNPEDGGGDTYGEIDESKGQEFAKFLNENVASDPLYGEVGPGGAPGGGGDPIYDEGNAPGWGYLDVKPDEDLYGGLADVFVDE